MSDEQYEKILEKLNTIESDLNMIKKHQKDNSFEKMVIKQWASFYGLSLAADIITGQKTPPSNFL